MNTYTFSRAVRITIPVFFGYLAIGIPFGLMVVNAGYPWWLAPLMSLLMYAGAGQYVAIGLFAAGAPLSAMLITTLLVNIRHIFYGLSLITPFKGTGAWKPYLVFALTDETYALMTGCQVPQGVKPGTFYGLIAVLDQAYWILGTVIGAAAGSLIPFSFDGVDFALTALFVVLLLDQLRKSHDMLPAAIGLAVSAASLFIFGPDNMLVAALISGMIVLVLVRGKKPDGGGQTI